jgi:hypothetical protein
MKSTFYICFFVFVADVVDKGASLDEATTLNSLEEVRRSSANLS